MEQNVVYISHRDHGCILFATTFETISKLIHERVESNILKAAMSKHVKCHEHSSPFLFDK